MNYRKLPIKELYHGIYVQVNPEIGGGIYKLIFEEGNFFYTTDGQWKRDSTLVLDNWYETDKTIEMNKEYGISSAKSGEYTFKEDEVREEKINQIL